MGFFPRPSGHEKKTTKELVVTPSNAIFSLTSLDLQLQHKGRGPSNIYKLLSSSYRARHHRRGRRGGGEEAISPARERKRGRAKELKTQEPSRNPREWSLGLWRPWFYLLHLLYQYYFITILAHTHEIPLWERRGGEEHGSMPQMNSTTNNYKSKKCQVFDAFIGFSWT